MKIMAAHAFKPPCTSPLDWRTALGKILVAVETDGELVGYGVGGGGGGTILRDPLLVQEVEPVEGRRQAGQINE
jgi:hypothetical protein